MSDIRAQVQKRAAALMDDSNDSAPPRLAGAEIDGDFVRACLHENERGDGILFSSLNCNRYLYNNTPKDGEWYRWADHVWQLDEKRDVVDFGVEQVALRYDAERKALEEQVVALGNIEKGDENYWKVELLKKYRSRVDRCRTKALAERILWWAPIVMKEMQVSEAEMDRKPMLLPCANGVIDLERGTILPGRQEDLLSKAIDIAYDPTVDTSPCFKFLMEILGSEEEAAFLQRSLGVSITGHSHEQFLWLLIGDGRNGKGVLMNVLSALLGPYYHVINAAMLVAKRNPPSPSATSEHIMSLRGKRMIVAGETNDHEKVDAREFKKITGDERLNARGNFAKEINFYPSHNTWLLTNHMLHGVASDFAMLQRLLILEFPYSFVDDPEAEARKNPARASFFRKKNIGLKDEMLSPEMLQRWLKFVVDGCLEWQDIGLAIPQSVIDRRDELAKQSDYFNEFFADCVELTENAADRIKCVDMYALFQKWFAATQNPGDTATKLKYPSMRSMNAAFRKRNYAVEKDGIYYIVGIRIPIACPYQYDDDNKWI